ncbi:MAG TPA: hypothetical protein PKO31_03600, partial [Methanofastidiosum sp.]|nr:hypothetical protein [Methanofastidiosum sp.]
KILNLDNLSNPHNTYVNPIKIPTSLLLFELIKINAGATPKEIMSDKESKLLPNSAAMFFFRAKNPSKLSKKIANKTILEERIKLSRIIKYIAKSPNVELINVKRLGKEINELIPVSFMISLIKLYSDILFNCI